MPEDEARIFTDAFELYNKYRWAEMQTEQQWMDLSNDCLAFAEKYDWRKNPLTFHLAQMILDVLGEMYRNGQKPKIPDYIGRGDL